MAATLPAAGSCCRQDPHRLSEASVGAPLADSSPPAASEDTVEQPQERVRLLVRTRHRLSGRRADVAPWLDEQLPDDRGPSVAATQEARPAVIDQIDQAAGSRG